MGISGLLPVLKEIQVHGNISEFKGKRLAVDVGRYLFSTPSLKFSSLRHIVVDVWSDDIRLKEIELIDRHMSGYIKVHLGVRRK